VIASDRLLPHDNDAERAVLGAILLDGTLYLQAAQILKSSDFYVKGHRKIFRAMVDTEAIDLVTIRERLHRHGDTLDDVGGFSYISGLLDGLPHSSNIEHYARIVKDKSLLRQIIAASNRINSECYTAEQDAREIYERALEVFAKLESERSGVRLRAMAEAHDELVDLLRAGIDGEGNAAEVIRAPWIDLGRFNLFPRGDLSIIAALTSMGKTMFMSNFAVEAARAGHHVIYFSKEDGGRKLRKRFLASLAAVPLRELMMRLIPEDSWKRAIPATEELTKLELAIPDGIGYGVGEMLAMAEARHLQKGVDLIVVDYLQLFDTNDEGRVRGLGDIVQRLRSLGQKLNAHVMVGCQLSRLAAQRNPKTGKHERPQLNHLRESGEIEQHADEVIFLHRDSYFDPERRGEMGETEILIAKNRNGETGKAELYFDGECQRVRGLTTSEVLGGARE